MNEKQKWFSTGYLRSTPSGSIDAQRGIIEGVSVCTAGEAKGHGVHLDTEFVQTITEQGAGLKKGLKARFGHPNMCSTALGTFIGRFKNFRMLGDQSKADLFLSNEAKDTPHGNLYEYVLGMAQNEPDMFGTSIVFTPGREYVRGSEGEKVYDFQVLMQSKEDNQPIYVECEKLHACDAVDEPAANDGFFSAFSAAHIGGQITEFLDLHPHVFEALQDNPNVIEALAEYGDKVDEFINRYSEYRNGKKDKGVITMKNDNHSEEQDIVDLESAEVSTEAAESTELETETETESTEAPESVEDTEDSEQAEEGTEESDTEEANDIDREEFSRSVEDFGAEISALAFADGGGYAEAQTAYIARLEAENAELKKKQSDGVSPVELGGDHEEIKPKRDILRNI